MAKYTIELRELIETFGEEEVKSWFMDYELSDYLTAAEIEVIEKRGTWSKEKLANWILDFYYMREIGSDTPGAFKRLARITMREIMEDRAPLIYSASIAYDPLVNVDFTESFERSSEQTTKSNGKSTNSGSGLTVNSDTPQGQISKAGILRGEYASSTAANENTSNINDETKSDSEGGERYTKTMKGNSGISTTAQRLIQQYRETITKINSDIIRDVAPLFMGVF